jgi:hypothetical protein
VPHLHTHSLDDHSASLEPQLEKKRERERGTFLGEGTFSICLRSSLGFVLAIYIKEVFVGFSPHEGFPG